MFSRQDYLNGRCTHREYYAQFVTDYVKMVVRDKIGIDRIMQSKDDRFSDIPMKEWDRLSLLFRKHVDYVSKEVGSKMGWSLGIGVCMLKEAARQIKEEELTKRVTA